MPANTKCDRLMFPDPKDVGKPGCNQRIKQLEAELKVARETVDEMAVDAAEWMRLAQAAQEREKQDDLDLRSILKAWALGDDDQMAAYMLPAFLRKFGKAPDLAAQRTEEPSE